MKMKLLCCGLFLITSVNAFAVPCDVKSVKTKEDVERAQDCMIQQLTELDNLLGSIREYHVRVKSQLTSLINEEAICKGQELIAKANPSNMTYQDLVDECNGLYGERQAKYSYVVDEYQKMEPHLKELETQKQALELKRQLLESAYDLIIRR